MKNLVIWVLAFFMLTSCIVIEFHGYRSGYRKLSPQERGRVKVLPQKRPINALVTNDTIYQINADQLKAFLASEDSALVYFWSPHCPGETCYPVKTVQELAEKQGNNLLVICDYFDFEAVQAQSVKALQYPLLAIHSDYYNSDICAKYQMRFRLDLFDIEEKDDLETSPKYSRYLWFYQGELVTTGARLLKTASKF